MLGRGEGGVGRILVAEHQPEADIALRAILVDLDGAVLGGVLEVDHGRERLVVDLDQLGGVARLRERLGHHESDAVADEAHLVGDEHGLERAVALGGAEILRHQVGGEGAELLRQGVGAGEHAEHARRGLRLRDVDALDAGMGVRREHASPRSIARAG